MSLGNTVLSDPAAWAVLVGFISPLAIQLITQRIGNAQEQAVAAFVVFCVLGAGTDYFAGDFSARSVVSSILLVLVTGLTSYESWWKPLGVTPKTTSSG